MLSDKLQSKLLEQVKYEWESSFYYLAMMAWCYNHDYDGFASWFYTQAQEERAHGEKLLSFVNEVGGELTIPSVSVPDHGFSSLTEIFEQTLEHEQHVTKLIHELMELAIKEHDHSTQNFLQWFVKEQIEEESVARTVLAKVRRVEKHPGALLMLENELAGNGEGLPDILEVDAE